MSRSFDEAASRARRVPLVIACGALAGDLRAVLSQAGLADAVEVVYLHANLHNRPERIVDQLRPLLDTAIQAHRPVCVGYADCGTGGLLDSLLAAYPGVQRLPGAHCYELFAGSELFEQLHSAEPGTFYLTDYLARHFDALVWDGLGLGEHPELRDVYFTHYTRVVHLDQGSDPVVQSRAEAAAERLGLMFERRHVGRDRFTEALFTSLPVLASRAS